MTPVLHMLCTLSCLPSLEIGKKICGSCVRHPAYTHSILFTQLDFSQQVGLCTVCVCICMSCSFWIFASLAVTQTQRIRIKFYISLVLTCYLSSYSSLTHIASVCRHQKVDLRCYGSCLSMPMRSTKIKHVLFLIWSFKSSSVPSCTHWQSSHPCSLSSGLDSKMLCDYEREPITVVCVCV